MMLEGTLSVSELTHYLRALFLEDALLGNVWVEGEVSNFVRARSGHCYFTLKEAKAALKVVMWKQNAAALSRLPENGDHIVVHGYIDIYPDRGEYQLYADFLRPIGLGDLYQRFLILKEKLTTEGLFAEERKRPLPAYPRRVGVVTSPTGAALRDIIRVIRGRYPLVEVDLFPTEVQGETAPARIVAALQNAAAYGVDVIILARGGGSLEDLWSFNDEAVVRAVAASPIPIISGVGHETDSTLTDFAADKRTPTPSAAAAAAVPDGSNLASVVASLRDVLGHQMDNALSMKREALRQQRRFLEHYDPRVRLAAARQQVDDMVTMLERNWSFQMRWRRQQVRHLAEKLTSLNPRSILGRGYALIYQQDGSLVREAAALQPGDPLVMEVYRGRFGATVTYIEENAEHGEQEAS